MANNFGHRSLPFQGSGGVTSMSGHAQRFQQIKSPGSNQQRREQFMPKSFGEPYDDDSNKSSVMGPAPVRNFSMAKQTSMPRQDDLIELRPKTTFKPSYQNTTTVAQHTFSTAARPVGPNPGHSMASAYLRGPGTYLGRGGGQGPATADQHDCTNEEYLDEFEMVDREEIFDECDEQTSMQKHQMNIGLTRHAVKSASPSDVFNVFNRPGSNHNSQMDVIKASQSGYSNNRSIALHQTSMGGEEFIKNQSPSMKDHRSRQGSLSPHPELAHIQKEAFFGSSFAACGSSGLVLGAQKLAQSSSNGVTGTKNYQMLKNSSINRLQAVNHVNQQSRFIQQRQQQVLGVAQAAAAAKPAAQDKGPRNFRHLEMGVGGIPDQFRADRANVGQDLAVINMMETSIQQDDEEAELEEESQSFELSHSLLPIMGGSQPGHSSVMNNHFVPPNEHHFLSTDQDTIIDQDDDVAEESSAIEQQDPAQMQPTQHHEGPSYNRFMSKIPNREEDIQDEEADVEEQQIQRQGYYNSFLGRQRSPLGFNLHTQQQTASNIPMPQPHSINATMASSQMQPQLQTSQSSMTFSVRGSVANKPFAAMVVPKHTSQSSMSRLQKIGQPNPSILDATHQPRPVGGNSHMVHQGLHNNIRSNGSTVVNSFTAGPAVGHIAKEQYPHDLQTAKRPSLTKCDNKDSKKLPGEITLNELQGEVPIEQTSQPTTYQYQNKHLTTQPEQRPFPQLQQNHLAIFASNKELQVMRGDTFRSPPQGSPRTNRANIVSPKVNTITKVASNIDPGEAILSQPFSREEDGSHLLASNHSTAHRGSDIHRQTANFYSSEQRGQTMMDVDVTNTSLRAGGAFSKMASPIGEIEDDFVNDTNIMNIAEVANHVNDANNENDFSLKSNLELQKEYLDVQRQLKALQKTQAAQEQHVKQSKVVQRQFFDDVTSLQSHATQQPKAAAPSQAFRKQQNNSMIYAQQISRHQQKNQSSSISDLAQNVSNRLNTSNKVSHMAPQGVQVASKKATVSTSQLQQTLMSNNNKDRSLQRPASSVHHAASQSGSQLRQIRLSARPGGGGGDGNLMRSPRDDVQSAKQKQLSSRRSPMPARAAALANEVCNDTMSAKNFSLAKTDKMRLRNAHTFVEKGQIAAAASRQYTNKVHGSHNQNRSVISNNNAESQMQNETASELVTQSLMLPGGRKPRAQAQQLQALAELRQRENNTVQTGQVILARQRSREAYLNTGQRSTGVAKSTQDRLNPNQSSESASMTDRHHKRGNSRATGGSVAHMLPGMNHMTEHADDQNDGVARRQSYLVQVNNKLGNSSTFDHRNHLESMEQGITADDNNSIEDVLSRSQSAQEDQPEIDGDNDSRDGENDLQDHDEMQGYQNEGYEDDVLYGRGSYHYGQDRVEEGDYDEEAEQLSDDEDETGHEGNYEYASEEDPDCDGYYDEEQQQQEEDELSSDGGQYVDEDGNVMVFATDDQNIHRASLPQYGQQVIGRTGRVESGQKSSIGAAVRIQRTAPSKQRTLNYSASLEGDADDEEVGGFTGQRQQVQRNDSQRRVSKYSVVGNQNNRHKSPFDAKSQYSDRKPLRAGQMHRSNAKIERANQKHLQQQISKQGAQRGKPRKQHDFQVDKNMKAQFNVTHNTRKRNHNQPLKININMTGGSTSGQHGPAVRQETSQSVASIQNAPQQQPPHYHHHQQQQKQQAAQQQMMLAAMYAQSHPALPHPNFYPPGGQDPSQQLQQYMMQHQQQSQQFMAAMNPGSQVSAHHQQPAQNAQMVYNHQNNPSTLTDINRINGNSWGMAENEISHLSSKAQRPRTVSMPLEEADTTSVVPNKEDGISWLHEAKASSIKEDQSKDEGISWLNNNQKANDIKEEDVSLEAKPAQEAEDDIDDLWKKIREHELSKNNARKAPAIQAVSREEEEDEEQLENFMVMNKPRRAEQKKKPEAMIIGFDNGLDHAPNQLVKGGSNAASPFINKPMLGAKRQAAAAAKRAETLDSKDHHLHDKKVTPFGADFKKVSVEQIQARDERLKRIKDQGLIEIAADNLDVGAQGNNLADAFAAKRRARMAEKSKDAVPLDQDLAVARDTSVNAKIAPKAEKAPKTAQELYQIRKAMTKRKQQPAQPSVKQVVIEAIPAASAKGRMSLGSQKPTAAAASSAKPTISKEPSAALMERLAGGKRAQIDKKEMKEMKKLTKTNYENLPEIKRRKDEERKRQEALEKKERIAKYNKECKARSRAQLKKKRDQAAAVAAAVTADSGTQ